MGAPRRLSADRIVAAALTAAEAGPLTMRAVAREAGCDPMAIYRHFPNRAALLDAAGDLALADVELPDDPRWDDRIVELYARVRAAVLRRPGLAPEFVARPPLGEHAARVSRATAAALREGGANGRQVVGALQVLQSYLGANIAQAVAPRDQQARATEVGRAMGRAGEHLLVNGSEELLRYGVRVIARGAVVPVAPA
ncbi:MAG TPA: TetR/AcrR family transcriptional regulator [Acidimicrobiales bacterium]